MAALRIHFIFLLCLSASTLLWGRPSFSETTISEQSLGSDIIIEEMYQPGNGLPVGKILSVWGQAIVFHRDPTLGYRAQTGLPLYTGDVMRTREATWVLCRLVDGSIIVLPPQTTLTIVQSSYNSARQTSVSFLYLKSGGARFRLNPMPNLSAYDFKIQTEATFTTTREADFVVEANPEKTDIVAFEKSRLEVTGTAQPEEVTLVSDFQRATAAGKISPLTVETLSREDIDALRKQYHTAPRSTLLAAGTDYHRQNHKTDDAVFEETIVEDQPRALDTE